MAHTDKDIAESFRRTRGYAATGKELGGVSRQSIERRILRMRADGVDFPPLKKPRTRSKKTKQ